MVVSLYRYRRFIVRSSLNEVRHRYAGSMLGAIWNIVTPLLQIALYTVVFSTLMGPHVTTYRGSAPERFAFVLYLCSGLLPWFTFAEGVARGTQSLVSNARYLQKMALPEAIFIAQTALATTCTAAIALALFALIGWPLGLPLGWAYLLIPIVLGLLQTLGFGLSLILAPLNVFFRDIGQALGLMLQLWMWSTPIVYSEQILPPIAQTLIRWNPAYGFIAAFHEIFLRNQAPSPALWGMMISWTVAFVGLGYVVLTRLRRELRDVI